MRAAAGLPEAEIRRILAEELPGMVVLGTGGEGHPSSMAACVVHLDRVLLEYLAVSAASRWRGIGGRLVRQVARLGTPVVAETADDAVGFYRKLGFLVTPAPEDPRWPGAARYRCVLGREPADDAGKLSGTPTGH
ncbi:Acetyltransferase (GNAT) domain-containing protein [Actinomyces ruminicola]|uniref:Acetyltransferase (GNAT) domain-containing protein n=2 Tax=Actinomyces ruminicola TaxID=332524 RepID=A0A1H0F803_9ACTO|nr:Acetyltransferase (GNAT) domain-containing protein [Actinomyces ruminicola]